MKSRYELGKQAGELALMLFRENVPPQQRVNIKYGRHFHTFTKYLTGDCIGGIYIMPKVYATAEKWSKSEDSIKALNTFVMDVAESGLTNTSIYQGCGKEKDEEWPWIGREFLNGLTEAIITRRA